MTGKIAMVGSGDSISVFQAAGVSTFPVSDEKQARETLRRVAQEYKVIFLTEDLSTQLGEFLKRFDEEAYPVLLTIPSESGSAGYGKAFLKSAMERALGVDILFRED